MRSYTHSLIHSFFSAIRWRSRIQQFAFHCMHVSVVCLENVPNHRLLSKIEKKFIFCVCLTILNFRRNSSTKFLCHRYHYRHSYLYLYVYSYWRVLNWCNFPHVTVLYPTYLTIFFFAVHFSAFAICDSTLWEFRKCCVSFKNCLQNILFCLTNILNNFQHPAKNSSPSNNSQCIFYYSLFGIEYNTC